jgi:Ca-activated chloride channel family protein
LLPLWLWRLRAAGRQRGGLALPMGAWFDDLPRSPRQHLAWLPDALRLLVLVALALALARPQVGRQTERLTQHGVDIMLALDLSGSMMAEDIRPNRCEAAKACLLRFLDRLQSDRAGLVVFAGRSFTQCPLTTDYGVLATMVAQCRVGLVAVDGTAIGDALGTSLYRLKTKAERARPTPESDARSRVVVLLTDGENNTGELEPSDAAALATAEGVRVHCIGLGTPEGAYLPEYWEGQRSGWLTDRYGRRMVSRLDEAGLQAIAARTGGVYFRATDAESLDRVYQRIAKMEKHTIEVRKQTRWEERFTLPLTIALVALLLELLLRATWLRVEQ